MGMGRWDHILDQRPQELKDYVLDKVAEQMVEDLRNFPPRIEEWLDAAMQSRYARVLTRLGRPELDTYRVACELAREENDTAKHIAATSRLIFSCAGTPRRGRAPSSPPARSCAPAPPRRRRAARSGSRPVPGRTCRSSAARRGPCPTPCAPSALSGTRRWRRSTSSPRRTSRPANTARSPPARPWGTA